jgi:hypothetical protein
MGKTSESFSVTQYFVLIVAEFHLKAREKLKVTFNYDNNFEQNFSPLFSDKYFLRSLEIIHYDVIRICCPNLKMARTYKKKIMKTQMRFLVLTKATMKTVSVI